MGMFLFSNLLAAMSYIIHVHVDNTLGHILLCVTIPLILIIYIFSHDSKTKDIEGRVVLITGPGMGIGQLTAIEIAKKGARVIVLWDISNCEETKAKISAINKSVILLSYVVDVSNPETVQQASKQVHEDLLALPNDGSPSLHVSIVINNAGIVCGKPFLSLEARNIIKTFHVNTLSHFYINKEFLPNMLQHNDGVIVTVASVMGLQGSAGLTDYCASKFALVGMHESLRLEIKKLQSGKKNGIQTILICPYGISTGMFNGIFENDSTNFVQKLFFPLLTPQRVANDIVKSISNGHPHVVLPLHLQPLITISKLFPVYVQVYLAALLGGEHGMDSFKGRGDTK